MGSISATEVKRQMYRLGDLAADGPVVILRSGKPIAIVMAQAEYHQRGVDAEKSAQDQAGMAPETGT